MADFINVPVSTDKDNIEYIKVKFTFPEPGETDKGEYTSYYWGCLIEDHTGTFTEKRSLGFYESLRKILWDLDGVQGNVDHRGKKLKAYRPTKDTVVEIGCLEERPGDSKSRRYEAYHISGPIKEVALGQPAQPQSPAPAQSSNGAQPNQGGNMFTQKQLDEGGKYKKGDPERDDLLMAIAADQVGYYFQIHGLVKEQVPKDQDGNYIEDVSLSALHDTIATIFIEANRKAVKYAGLYDEAVVPDQSNNQPASEEFPMPEGAVESVWNELVKAGSLGDKGKIVTAFFDTLIKHTATQNEFSCKAALKLMGISTVPAGPYAKYDAYSKMVEYYHYREQGDEPETAAGKVVARYEAV